MAVLKNRAKMSTSATGTGSPITLGSAEDGYQTFADAGVANADVVRYVIEDGNNFEIGTGTYTATGTTLSRTVSESSNSDAAINLSGSATVFIGATAEDIPALYAANPSSATDPTASGANAVAIGSNAISVGSSSVALGYSRADGSHSFAVAGVANSTSYGADDPYSIAIGRLSKAEAANAVALGYQARATGDSSVALGRSYAGNQDSFAAAIGDASSSKGARGANSVALGQDARAIGANSITIGTNVSNAVANQISLGGTTDTLKISDSYTLPTADGTNGQVLTTDGSGAVTFADAGGGADLYAALIFMLLMKAHLQHSLRLLVEMQLLLVTVRLLVVMTDLLLAQIQQLQVYTHWLWGIIQLRLVSGLPLSVTQQLHQAVAQ